jgi:hypothetical protein
VTGGGPTDVDQAIGQGAGQAANVTGGGPTDLEQLIGQNANQSAQVTDEEEE